MKPLFRNLLCAGAIALALSPSAFAQNRAPAETPISPEQASGSAGQRVTVEGIASLGDANGMPDGVFVRLMDVGRGAVIAGYISKGNEERFPDLRSLEGKLIVITGVVETETGIPIIRVTSADQIRIVR